MLLIVERKDAVCWMKPDVEITQAGAEQGINKTSAVGSFHTGGVNAATQAGGVHFISDTIDTAQLHELITGPDHEMP